MKYHANIQSGLGLTIVSAASYIASQDPAFFGYQEGARHVVMARQRIARGEETGNGLALAGLICGIIAVVLFVIGLILIALGAGAVWFFGDEIEQWEREWELDIEPGEPMPAPAPADPAMRRPASLQLVGHWP